MLGSVFSNFFDIVIIGERIEFGLKSRKIAHGQSAGTNPNIENPKRKEGEVQVTFNNSHYDIHPSYVSNNLHQQNRKGEMKSNQGRCQNSTPNKDVNQKKKVVQFTPILMTYTKLLRKLLSDKLVAICPLTLMMGYLDIL